MAFSGRSGLCESRAKNYPGLPSCDTITAVVRSLDVTEITLESLAQRLAALERKVASMSGVVPASKDWRSVVGMFERNEFNRQMDEEIQAMRIAEEQALADEVPL